MKKIVILGCENSHANSFLDFIKDDPKYSDVEVLGVYSDDIPAAEKLREKYGVKLLDSYDACVGEVDGVIVTARHGANHYKYAKPYIASGVPMFIDKPITICGDEAVAFMKECKENNVKITGGSSCKHIKAVKDMAKDVIEKVDGETIGGCVRAPMNLDNAYGKFYFYSQHLVEMVMTIYGRYPKSIKTYVNGKTYTIVFRYDSYDIIGRFVDQSFYYSISRETENKTVSFETPVTRDCFLAEFDEFYNLLSGGEQTISYNDFISPVFALNAIEESINTGSEVVIKEFNV